MIAQRLHVDDLPCRLLERGGWYPLILPLIAPHDIHYHYAHDRTLIFHAGSLLHPERIDMATAMRTKQEIGTALFEAQYNQRPVPAGGYLFKLDWLRYDETPINPLGCEYVVQSWDTALAVQEKNDFTVCVTIGKIGPNFHILDLFQKQVEFAEQPDLGWIDIQDSQRA